MVLVDTSVWIDHFRVGEAELTRLLAHDEVATHLFVVGELAAGNLKDRDSVLAMFDALPHLGTAQHQEVLHLLSAHKLYGTGIGWVDLHLLTAAKLHGLPILSHDGRMATAAKKLKIAY